MSLEDPTVPLGSPDYDDDDVGRSSSGVVVSRRVALGLSAVWRGVNLIAGDVGRHDFRVYRYPAGGGGGLVEDPRHQAARVMRRPNEYMTPFTFRQTLQAHALLASNGYAYIVRDPLTAAPLELLPLNPDGCWPVRVDGVLWYVAEADDPLPGRRRKQSGPKMMVKIPAADVLHIKGLGFDGLLGYSVVALLRDTFGAAVAAREYGARFFLNDGSPGVVIEVPAGMKDAAIANVRQSWAKMHVGIKNKHRLAILREGMKLSSYIGANARDAQLHENRQFDTLEIANVLGVPPHKLGDPSKTAYNSLESENQAYHEDTLDRWFVAWQQECDAKLLTEEEKEQETHTCRFDARSLSRVNLAVRGSYYSQAITGGWLSRDEVRGMENKNPIPGGRGSEFVLPVNVAPAPPPAEPAPAPPADPQPQQASAALVAAMRGVARSAVGRIATRAAKRGEWSAGWVDGSVPGVSAELGPVVEMARAAGFPPPADYARHVCLLLADTLANHPDQLPAAIDAAADALFPEKP